MTIAVVNGTVESTQQDYASAQYHLGMKYSFGTGVTQNHSEAVKWYRKAAEQDHVGAQYALGWGVLQR